MSCELEENREVKPALVPSLFPFRPPTLYFSTANERGQYTHWLCRGFKFSILNHSIATSETSIHSFILLILMTIIRPLSQ